MKLYLPGLLSMLTALSGPIESQRLWLFVNIKNNWYDHASCLVKSINNFTYYSTLWLFSAYLVVCCCLSSSLNLTWVRGLIASALTVWIDNSNVTTCQTILNTHGVENDEQRYAVGFRGSTTAWWKLSVGLVSRWSQPYVFPVFLPAKFIVICWIDAAIASLIE